METANNIIICTRMHKINEDIMDEMLTKVIRLIDNTPENNKIVIAIDNSIDVMILINKLKEQTSRSIDIFNNKNLSNDIDIYIVQISYWGKFVFALNILLDCARLLGGKYILYQSLEIDDTTNIYNKLIEHFDPNTLCVGIKLPDHTKDLEEGLLNLTGSNSPWNTYAIWDISKLSLTGFCMVSEIGDDAGIEEVATISILQLINNNYEVKLIEYDNNDNNKNLWQYIKSPENKIKIDSKNSRASNQLKLLNKRDTVKFIKIPNEIPSETLNDTPEEED